MSRERDLYHLKEDAHRNILSQKRKKSVGKFLKFSLFKILIYHTLTNPYIGGTKLALGTTSHLELIKHVI